MEKRHKSELLPYVQALETLQSFLHKKLNDVNADSMKTKAGTFFLKKKESVTVASRETFFQWMRDNNQWDLADIRAGKTNILAYMEQTKQLPPGLDYSAFIEVQVRKGTGAKRATVDGETEAGSSNDVESGDDSVLQEDAA